MSGAETATHPRGRILTTPRSTLGWWTVGLTVAIFPVAWVLMSHAISWAILDTALAPVILMTLIDGAAACCALALVRKRDRSILVITSAVVVFPLALFATVMIVLEVLSPH